MSRHRIQVECQVCHGTIEVEVEDVGYGKWATGEAHIQNAMPYLTPGQRELLISNTCEPCFDMMFKETDHTDEEMDEERGIENFLDEDDRWEGSEDAKCTVCGFTPCFAMYGNDPVCNKPSCLRSIKETR